MSKVQIITTPNPLLRESAQKATPGPETDAIIARMVEASLEWEKSHPHELSAAMAAPQIGEPYRIIILRDDLEDKENDSFTALLNPEVIREEGPLKTDYEGCLSVADGIYGLVPRYTKIKVKAFLADGQEVRVKVAGPLARTILHEVDHLNGILFIDRIKGKKDAFFRLNDQGELDPLDYDKEIAGNKTLFPDE